MTNNQLDGYEAYKHREEQWYGEYLNEEQERLERLANL